MDIEKAIEDNNRIHDAILALIKEWPSIFLGENAWLADDIGEHDFWMDTPVAGSIGCIGVSYSMESMRNERYLFSVPLKDVQEWLDAHDPD